MKFAGSNAEVNGYREVIRDIQETPTRSPQNCTSFATTATSAQPSTSSSESPTVQPSITQLSGSSPILTASSNASLPSTAQISTLHDFQLSINDVIQAKALITKLVSTILWSDVKYLDNQNYISFNNFSSE